MTISSTPPRPRRPGPGWPAGPASRAGPGSSELVGEFLTQDTRRLAAGRCRTTGDPRGCEETVAGPRVRLYPVDSPLGQNALGGHSRIRSHSPNPAWMPLRWKRRAVGSGPMPRIIGQTRARIVSLVTVSRWPAASGSRSGFARARLFPKCIMTPHSEERRYGEPDTAAAPVTAEQASVSLA
jgi:hypothetical protein